MLDAFDDRHHGSRRYAMLFEFGKHRLVRGHRRHPRFDYLDQLFLVTSAIGVGREARIVDEFRSSDRVGHAGKLPLQRKDHYVTLRTLEHAARAYELVMRTQ